MELHVDLDAYGSMWCLAAPQPAALSKPVSPIGSSLICTSKHGRQDVFLVAGRSRELAAQNIQLPFFSVRKWKLEEAFQFL